MFLSPKRTPVNSSLSHLNTPLKASCLYVDNVTVQTQCLKKKNSTYNIDSVHWGIHFIFTGVFGSLFCEFMRGIIYQYMPQVAFWW